MKNKDDDSIYKFQPIWGVWEIDELLGKGSIGKVYKIIRKDYNVEYVSAIKFLSFPTDEQYNDILNSIGNNENVVNSYLEDHINTVINEINLLYQLKGHSNIISYEDHLIQKSENEKKWFILIRMEYATSLSNYLKNNTLNESEVISLGIDICNALELCHSKDIIHRDIKEANIFISQNNTYKLGDFSVSKSTSNITSAMTKVGTLNYMPPEIIKGQKYDKNVDLYSLGIMMYKLLNNGRNPHLPKHPNKITQVDVENSFEKRISGEPFENLENINPELNKILLKSCAYNPQDRYKNVNEMKKALLNINIKKTNNSDLINQSTIENETIDLFNSDSIKNEYKSNKKIVITGISLIIFVLLSIFIIYFNNLKSSKKETTKNNNYVLENNNTKNSDIENITNNDKTNEVKNSTEPNEENIDEEVFDDEAIDEENKDISKELIKSDTDNNLLEYDNEGRIVKSYLDDNKLIYNEYFYKSNNKNMIDYILKYDKSTKRYVCQWFCNENTPYEEIWDNIYKKQIFYYLEETNNLDRICEYLYNPYRMSKTWWVKENTETTFEYRWNNMFQQHTYSYKEGTDNITMITQYQHEFKRYTYRWYCKENTKFKNRWTSLESKQEYTYNEGTNDLIHIYKYKYNPEEIVKEWKIDPSTKWDNRWDNAILVK